MSVQLHIQCYFVVLLWTPFGIHHYYSNACASQRCTQIIMLPSVDNSSIAAHNSKMFGCWDKVTDHMSWVKVF